MTSTMQNSDFAKAIRGEPNLTDAVAKFTRERHEQARLQMMTALRFARDHHPREWDALMATGAGPMICSAWDELR